MSSLLRKKLSYWANFYGSKLPNIEQMTCPSGHTGNKANLSKGSNNYVDTANSAKFTAMFVSDSKHIFIDKHKWALYQGHNALTHGAFSRRR